jgi:hypothetical protein
MNFKSIFAIILQGASSGAIQGLQSTPEGQKVSWQAVGIVAAFGALVGLTHALQTHPAVAATQPAPAAAQ